MDDEVRGDMSPKPLQVGISFSLPNDHASPPECDVDLIETRANP
jgi:hypothetical protein